MQTTSRATTTVLAAVALLASACTVTSESAGPAPVPSPSVTASATPPSPDPTTPEPGPTADPTPALVISLGDACDGIGDPPDLSAHTLTFTVGDQLHEVDRAGGRSVCLAEGVEGDIEWGRQGDRVLVGERLLTAGSRTPAVIPAGTASSGFTRPTGTSTLAIGSSGRVLTKTAVSDGTQTDVTFLAQHDEVVYYPSGTHILAIGTHLDGRYGIWLATNTGDDVKLLGEPGPDVLLHGLSIDPAGVHLIFTADHGDEHHVHRAQMLGESLAGGTDERAAETVITSDEPLGNPVTWIDGWAVAASTGDCADGGRDLAVFHEEVLDQQGLPAGDTVPIGWLGYGELVVAVARDGCVGTDPVELWLLSTDAEPELVVTGASAAALRTRDGDAPPPPIENFSGFA